MNKKNTLSGLFFGLFFAGIASLLLYMAESQENISKYLVKAEPVDINRLDQSLEGKLVYLSGNIITDELTGDDLLLKPGNYIAVKRISQMYSRKEKSSDSSSKTRNKKLWTENPPPFDNPTQRIKSQINKVNKASIGNYLINVKNADISGFKEIKIDEFDLYDNNARNYELTENNWIYMYSASPQKPGIGDIRLRYKAIQNNEFVTVFGKLNANYISDYNYKKDTTLLKIYSGTKEEAIKKERQNYRVLKWGARIICGIFILAGTGIILGSLGLSGILVFLGGAISTAIIMLIIKLAVFISN